MKKSSVTQSRRSHRRPRRRLKPPLRDHNATEPQVERAHRSVKADVKRARASGRMKPFTENL